MKPWVHYNRDVKGNLIGKEMLDSDDKSNSKSFLSLFLLI